METSQESRDSAALVLAYGSLKRGMRHHRELAGAHWQGQGSIAGLALYDLGPFPMAVPEAGALLQGEIYAVDHTLINALDAFEGAPRLYQRQLWPLTDGKQAWVYVGRPRQVRHVARIASGIWTGETGRRKASR
jgi:gamma-glutamylcyclotransferase (GGCT)/AIG2-like uncharacterized protein YtfP